MTANRGLFVRNNGTTGTTPIEGRLVLASLVAENATGTPRQGLLDQKATTVVSGTASMTYSVAPCNVVVNRAAGEGVYLFTLTGTTTVATTAAPGTGSRWDLIYVKQNDLDKGDANNTAVLAVLQGTSSTGTPTKPYASLPAGAYVLAEAQVSAGATATNGAQVAISQVWRYTALRGVPVPVRNQAERDEISTPPLNMEIKRLDQSGPDTIERWSGSAWANTRSALPFAHMGKTNAFQALGGTLTTVTMDAAQTLIGGFTFDNANDALVVPVTGWYNVRIKGFFTGNSAGVNQVGIVLNGVKGPTGVMQGVISNINKMDGNDVFVISASRVPFNAGDKVGMYQYSAVSCWGTNGYDGSYIELEYVCPL